MCVAEAQFLVISGCRETERDRERERETQVRYANILAKTSPK